MAINRQNKSKMGHAMQRAEKLRIFKDNIEAIGCLYEALFADEKKADFFLNLLTKMMIWWIEKEFDRRLNSAKEEGVSEEAGNSDLYEDINEFEDIEDGNGDYNEFTGEVVSEDEFLERFSL
ncbi:hypothetical protein GcM1_239135 [Golovinomyces cichoracearum]|uniref:Uncharacterized protein n=1 Tax=Golovinomyces cichoracearum TaxID=62708 RepID=A0A420IJ27_9PEZI|nr:hypothetical protein GcM1_239135 [Golovinomyces cichoracearum]